MYNIYKAASSPPEGAPASAVNTPAPETVVEPEGVGGHTVWPVRSCEATLEPGEG